MKLTSAENFTTRDENETHLGWKFYHTWQKLNSPQLKILPHVMKMKLTSTEPEIKVLVDFSRGVLARIEAELDPHGSPRSVLAVVSYGGQHKLEIFLVNFDFRHPHQSAAGPNWLDFKHLAQSIHKIWFDSRWNKLPLWELQTLQNLFILNVFLSITIFKINSSISCLIQIQKIIFIALPYRMSITGGREPQALVWHGRQNLTHRQVNNDLLFGIGCSVNWPHECVDAAIASLFMG